MEGGAETRWLVLSGDGRHVTLGRHRDPDAAEVEQAERTLAAQGLAGWLVLMKGAYYVRKKPVLMMVRPLGTASPDWDTAVASFEAHWREATRPAATARSA